GRPQRSRNLFVLVTLDDQGDDFELLGGQAVADTRAYQIVFRALLALLRVLHPSLAFGDLAHTLHQGLTTHVSVDHTIHAVGQVMAGVLSSFRDDDWFVFVFLR